MIIVKLVTTILNFILRIWGWVSGHSKQKLMDRRLLLEDKSRQAQIDGDIDELRKIRAEINEIDRNLEFGNY